MTRTQLISIASIGSFALLSGAFLFQALGYAPCQMCIWQRWPHVAAIGCGLLAIAFGSRALAGLGALAALTTAAIGLFHTGVERDWWEGPTACSGGGAALQGVTGDSLLSTEQATVIMCDVVAWEFLSLSMASWNMIISIILAAIWIMAARRPA